MVWNAEPAECRFNAFYRNTTLPETNIAHENPIFPGKYHQNGGFSWAMLVLGRVKKNKSPPHTINLKHWLMLFHHRPNQYDIYIIKVTHP